MDFTSERYEKQHLSEVLGFVRRQTAIEEERKRVLDAEIDEMLDELNDYVESIDDDLSELEGSRDDEDEDEDFDFLHGEDDDDFAVSPFGSEDQLHLLANDDEEDEALEGGICPECGGISFITAENGLNGRYVCPHCKKKVVLLPLLGDNTPIATPVDED